MLDFARIRAITLDLDDTLWPIAPTMVRCERVLQQWLTQYAPLTATLWGQESTRHAFRTQVNRIHADKAHDLTHLRRESIRLALLQAGEAPALAEPAFEHFFAERQRVELFPDALPCLDALSRRWPVVAVTNGNADIHRVGIGKYFHGYVSAREVGVGKPDPYIYQVAAQKAGVDLHEILHIGDDALLDVVAAATLGMQTAWVNRTGGSWIHPTESPHCIVRDLHSLVGVLPSDNFF